MTFKTTVVDKDGKPIQGVLACANVENNGATFMRSTDGAGFADVAILGVVPVGSRVTFYVTDPEFRFKGKLMGDALVIGADDQVIKVVLDPFV